MLLCLKYFRMVKISEEVSKLVVSKMLDRCGRFNIEIEINLVQSNSSFSKF